MTSPCPGSATITAAGWSLSRAMARAPGSEALLSSGLPDIGADAGTARGAGRGPLAVVAETVEEAPAAENAALVALLGLVDGFYGARPTLGDGQALTQALTAINRWMFAQRGTDGQEPGPAASISAIVFGGTRAGLLQIGGGLILRVRAGELTRLAEPQLLGGPHGTLAVRRALGADSRVLLDFLEDTVLPGDRYILVSDVRRPESPETRDRTIDGRALRTLCGQPVPAAILAGLIAAFPETDATAAPRRAALVVDVEAVPSPTLASAEASLLDLPLAPVPQEGENRDGYRIGRTLHRGAYTLLKQATDLGTGEAVVLKYPLPAMLHDRVFQAGFARETWVGTAIHSPAVARVIPPEPGRRSSLYIVMPYYRGETLEARLERDPHFPVADIVEIGLQLCRAVEDLRAIQVLHRDLKPENVMLVAGGGLRLLDLGLAYLADLEDSAAQGLAGTIRYMAPELLRGSPPNDTTEVYALGVMLHRLAAFGRFPRAGADIAAGLARARPDLPPRLAGAIATALSSSPSERPRHAGALAQAVSAALHDDTGSRLAGPFARRRSLDPLTLWRAIALLLGLALLGTLALR
ncbi:MAG: protein kinase [Proteobacteria bacterium]|nr:protein kinase [Pseudomonadota bacterium]